MNVNVVHEIKRAEEKARMVLDSSKEESKKIFNDAFDKANSEYEKIVNASNDEYKKIISIYETEGNEAVLSLEKKSETSISDILNVSDKRKKLGVKRVVEGIVNLWQ